MTDSHIKSKKYLFSFFCKKITKMFFNVPHKKEFILVLHSFISKIISSKLHLYKMKLIPENPFLTNIIKKLYLF